MSRLATIEIFREDLNFSAGHFTIFSATHREKLHGHNYQVSAAITTKIEENGLRVDYRHYHDKVATLCQRLNLAFLLPAKSRYLKIEEHENYYHAHFDQEMIPFLKKDVIILPIENTTIEELSDWFLQQLVQDQADLDKNGVQAITLRVSSNAGRSGSSTWSRL